MNLILEGFMGSGKSAIGRRLAKRAGYEFIDTDEVIETKQSRSISDIFAKQGEEAFRQMETAVLGGLVIDRRDSVISLGGGTPMRDANIPLIRKLGKVIYLKAPCDLLIKRLERSHAERPMLKGQDLSSRVRELLLEREERYMELSDLTIELFEEDVDETCRRIWDETKGLEDI